MCRQLLQWQPCSMGESKSDNTTFLMEGIWSRIGSWCKVFRVETNIIKEKGAFLLSSVSWNEDPNGFCLKRRRRRRKRSHITLQLWLFAPVGRFCLYIIDSLRLLLLLLLANRLLEIVFSKGRGQMKGWDSCNFWMTPSWQRQCPSIVPSHYSLLSCQGAFCIFCWFLCWTLSLQVRPQKPKYFCISLDKTFTITNLYFLLVHHMLLIIFKLNIFFYHLTYYFTQDCLSFFVKSTRI